MPGLRVWLKHMLVMVLVLVLVLVLVVLMLVQEKDNLIKRSFKSFLIPYSSCLKSFHRNG
jgi:hypothetical protein